MSGRGRAVRIHINGASPYGFRLVRSSQGEAVVTKLRPKSKGATAGLVEGDIITAVNGYNCNQISHDRVMSLMEHAGHYIDLDVWRSSDDANRANSAMKRSRDWDCYDSAPDSPSFDLLASTYQFDNFTKNSPPINHCHTDNDDYDDDWNYFGAENRQRSEDRDLMSPCSRWGTTRSAGCGVAGLRWNRDRSVTMSVDLFEEKENSAPAKHRNEAFIMINSPPLKEPFRWQPIVTTTRSQSVQPTSCYDDDDDDWSSRRGQGHNVWRETASESGMIDLEFQFDPLPPEVVKIITASSDADSLPEDLFPKKNVFADSSFYNDNKHSYPTVEEQIKMARKVALSLESPVNQDTRGHRMFMKRKAKLDSDSECDGGATSSAIGNQPPSGNLYYNPTPWQSVKPWEPKHATAAAVAVADQSYSLPSAYSRVFSAASPIPSKTDENSSKAMSADEFERVRLFDQKTTHDALPPQVCFSLANDLRNSNSKGGKMFAKRRAKADQWTTENLPSPVRANDNVADKVKAPNAVCSQTRLQPDNATRSSVTKLEIRRGPITPWDAVVEYGDVAPAFEHLNNVTFVKPQTTKTLTTGMTSASRLNRPAEASSAHHVATPRVTSTTVAGWSTTTTTKTGIGAFYANNNTYQHHRPIHFSSIITDL